MRGSIEPGYLSRSQPQGLALNPTLSKLRARVKSREVTERRQVGDAESLIHEEAMIHEEGQQPVFERIESQRGHQDII